MAGTKHPYRLAGLHLMLHLNKKNHPPTKHFTVYNTHRHTTVHTVHTSSVNVLYSFVLNFYIELKYQPHKPPPVMCMAMCLYKAADS